MTPSHILGYILAVLVHGVGYWLLVGIFSLGGIDSGQLPPGMDTARVISAVFVVILFAWTVFQISTKVESLGGILAICLKQTIILALLGIALPFVVTLLGIT